MALMGCLKCFVKPAFMVLTGLILFFGLIFAVLGLVLLLASDKLGDLGDSMREDIGEYVTDIMPKSAASKLYKKDEFLNIDLGAIISSVSVGLIVFGAFFLVVGLVGCVIAKLDKWLFWGAYTAVWVVISVVFISIVASLPDMVETKMVDMLDTYSGFTDFSAEGVTWTGIMVYFKCCGAYSFKDFHSLDNWPDKKLNEVNLLPSDPSMSEKQRQEAFEKTVKDLGDGRDIDSKDLKAISDASKNHPNDPTQGLTPDQKKIKAKLDALPVDINLVNFSINLDVSKFETPIACCRWDPDTPSMDGTLTSGCNLKGRANATNNNMDKGCMATLSDYFSEGNGEVNGILILTILAYVAFGFLVVYCGITALLTLLTFIS